jgi:hypothetical protein
MIERDRRREIFPGGSHWRLIFLLSDGRVVAEASGFGCDCIAWDWDGSVALLLYYELGGRITWAAGRQAAPGAGTFRTWEAVSLPLPPSLYFDSLGVIRHVA